MYIVIPVADPNSSGIRSRSESRRTCRQRNESSDHTGILFSIYVLGCYTKNNFRIVVALCVYIDACVDSKLSLAAAATLIVH